MAALALPENCVSNSCSEGLRALEQTFQAAPIGIAHVGADGTWLRVNQQVCEMLGYGADELMSLTFQDLTHPADLHTDVGLVNQVLDGEIDRYKLEKRYFHKDGHIVWANLTVAAVRDGRGRFVHFISVLEDISEMRQVHIALAETEERLRRVLNSVVAYIAVLSTDGAILLVNDPALTVAGLSREEVLGEPLWDTYWFRQSEESKARVRDAVTRAALGERSRFDVDVMVKDGTTRAIDFKLVPNHDEAGNVYEIIASGVDVTERKRGEEHREMLLRELSHRVKNTLAMVQAMANHTMRNTGDFERFQSAYKGRLSAIARCHDLLVATDHVSVGICDLVATQVRPYTRGDGKTLVLEGKPLVLSGEAAHAFGLVLHELATNAAKYGALSNQTGQVHIAWDKVRDETGDWVEITWTEAGGPPVAQPTQTGFGSALIRKSLSHSVGGSASVRYAEAGLSARFRLPLDAAL